MPFLMAKVLTINLGARYLYTAIPHWLERMEMTITVKQILVLCMCLLVRVLMGHLHSKLINYMRAMRIRTIDLVGQYLYTAIRH